MRLMTWQALSISPCEQVKVGELRLVLSLAEKGPLPLWATKMSAYDRFPLAHSHEVGPDR